MCTVSKILRWEFLFLWLCVCAYGDQNLESSRFQKWNGRTVRRIEFSGLKKTDPAIVQREFLFSEGDTFDHVAYYESLQRLWNIRLFWKIEDRVVSTTNSEVEIKIHFEESWTIIPLIRLVGAGATTQIVLGVYDVNLFGRFLELGGQYQNLGGASSYGAWYADPRLFGKRLRWQTDVFYEQRIRMLYDTEAAQANPQKETAGIILKRARVTETLSYEMNRYLTYGGALEWNQDRITDAQLGAEIKETNQANRSSPLHEGDKHRGRALLARAQATLGRMDRQNFLFWGTQAQVIAERALPVAIGEMTFHRFRIEGRHFLRLPLDSNFGVRLATGHSSATQIQNLNFLGGLESVRGYLDSQFRGKSFWLANVEFRIPSFQNRWLIAQHTVFYDVGQVAPSPSALTPMTQKITKPFSSAGVGVVLFIPKIYDMSFRLDYAFALDGRGPGGFAFGGTQFF